MRQAPVQVPLDDENFPDEIKMLVCEVNAETIVYYRTGYGMQQAGKLFTDSLKTRQRI